MNIEFDSWFKGNFFGKLAESNRFVTMYLVLDLLLKKQGGTLIETGTIRQENDWLSGMSTFVFGSFCKKYNYHLHSVDINPEAIEVSRRATNVCGDSISYHAGDSVSFLRNFNQTIDLLYLDSMDCPSQGSETSPQLLASQNHQLNEIKAAYDKLSDDAIVLLDDNDFQNGGKTRFSKLFLKENGFMEIMNWKQSLWVKAQPRSAIQSAAGEIASFSKRSYSSPPSSTAYHASKSGAITYSCLTITQSSRIALLQKSLYSFSQQTVNSNQREIVIVHHDGNQFTREIQKFVKKYQIEAQVIEVSPAPLGALRNVSIQHAKGKLLCQWDDDDFYHPQRLIMQSAPFEKSNCIATTLGEQLYWFQNSGDLYVRSSGKDGIPGTVMFLRNSGIQYQSSMCKSEDTVLIDEIKQGGTNSLCRIGNHPELYVRTYHGLNTWDIDHFKKLTKGAFSMDWLLENEVKMREWAKMLNISEVNVRDSRHQIAFQIA